MDGIEAIIYTSNAGHTKEYAELLSNEIGLPAYSLDSVPKTISKGAAIIYMGWLMAGSVKGFKKATKTFDVKAVCGVGMAENGQQIPDMLKKNPIPGDMKVFSLQGGLEVEKLHGMYKMMMGAACKAAGKRASEGDETALNDPMLSQMADNKNHVCLENLQEIIQWFKSE